MRYTTNSAALGFGGAKASHIGPPAQAAMLAGLYALMCLVLKLAETNAAF